MSAGRMTDRRDPIEVERRRLGQLTNEIGAVADFFEGSRPSSPRITNPTISQTPGRVLAPSRNQHVCGTKSECGWSHGVGRVGSPFIGGSG